MNSRSNQGFTAQEPRPWRPPGIVRCLGLQRPESLQNALLHSVGNMSGGLAQSFLEKSRLFQPQDLHIEGRGGLQEITATLTFRSKALVRGARLWLKNDNPWELSLPWPRPRNCTPKPLSPNKSLQRSADHKVLGRGRPSHERTRALARPRAERPACRR